MSVNYGDRPLSTGWMAWSWGLGRFHGIEFRISWTLLLTMALQCWTVVRLGHPLFLPCALLIPPAVVLVHALGHLWMLQLVRGRSDQVLLWALGDRTSMSLPITAGRQFLVAAAGPFISLLIWVTGVLALRLLQISSQFSWIGALMGASDATALQQLTSLGNYCLGLAAVYSLSIAAWNLFPSSVFDGGRLWRAVVWPMLGLRRAVWVAIFANFICSGLLVILAFLNVNLFMLTFAVLMLMTAVVEYRMMRHDGYDLVMEVEAGLVGRSTAGGWLGRWRRARTERTLVRDEAAAEQEQAVLDRLLAKVSAEGLPSLTAGERKTLARISKQQKARSEAGSPY